NRRRHTRFARDWSSDVCPSDLPEHVAISGDGRVLTYASLLSEAKALAATLQELGMQEGDVLSFQIPNWVEAAVVNLAADLIGAVLGRASCRARVYVAAAGAVVL